MPLYPQAVGGVVNDHIVICGGYLGPYLEGYARQKCWASDPMGWLPIGDLTNPKVDHGKQV